MYPLIGINLLRLLSQNRLSDFHTALETIDFDQLQSNPCIKQAVDLGNKRRIKGLQIADLLYCNRAIFDGRQLQQGVEHKKHRTRRRVYVLLRHFNQYH
jgi:hypothetical protein